MKKDSTPSTPPAVRIRRPQAERRADTKARLIKAAIHCIYELGLGATTLAHVAEAAGVSRGALTHHFPSKNELVLAVVRAIYEDDLNTYDTAARKLDALEWVRSLPETLWTVVSRPSGIAVMEIFLASRADDALAQQLSEIQREIDLQAAARIREHFAAAGIALRENDAAIRRLFVAAARGLAMEMVFTHQREPAAECIQILTDVMSQVYPMPVRANAQV